MPPARLERLSLTAREMAKPTAPKAVSRVVISNPRICKQVKANSTISEMRTIDKMKACSVTSILERRSRFCTKEMADLISAQPMANTTTAFKRLKGREKHGP